MSISHHRFTISVRRVSLARDTLGGTLASAGVVGKKTRRSGWQSSFGQPNGKLKIGRRLRPRVLNGRDRRAIGGVPVDRRVRGKSTVVAWRLLRLMDGLPESSRVERASAGVAWRSREGRKFRGFRAWPLWHTASAAAARPDQARRSMAENGTATPRHRPLLRLASLCCLPVHVPFVPGVPGATGRF